MRDTVMLIKGVLTVLYIVIYSSYDLSLNSHYVLQFSIKFGKEMGKTSVCKAKHCLLRCFTYRAQ